MQFSIYVFTQSLMWIFVCIMRSVLKTPSVSECNVQDKENVVENILDIIKLQQESLPLVLENSEKFLKAKEKVLKQLPNMYKNTRLHKFTVQNNSVSTRVEYKKVKGLVLNIEKRMSWYLNVEESELKCLLISTNAKTANEDLINDDRSKYFFNYYGKLILNSTNERKFITIPLLDLNVVIV